MSEREPLVDAVAAYMGWLNAIPTVARPAGDEDLAAQLAAEFDDALDRYRARSRARQEAAEEQQRA